MPFPNCHPADSVWLVRVGCREPLLTWRAALGFPRWGEEELLLLGHMGEHGWESWLGSAESSPCGFGFVLGVAKKSAVEKPPDFCGKPPAICL